MLKIDTARFVGKWTKLEPSPQSISGRTPKKAIAMFFPAMLSPISAYSLLGPPETVRTIMDKNLSY